MAAKLFFLPHLTATVNGIAVPGAKASFYQTGTTTPLTVYQDAALSVPHSSPVVANGAGRFPAIYLDDTVVYRLILTDRDDAELSGGDIDPFVAGVVPDASALQPYQTACEAATVTASAEADDAAASATAAAASNSAAANAAADAEASEVNSEAAAVLAALAADAAVNVMQGVTGASLNASTRGALSLLGTTLPAILTESGREGIFVFSSANLSAEVAIDSRQAIYVAPASNTTGASGAWVRRFSGAANVKWFGVTGDGATNDTVAFQAALDACAGVCALGVPAGTYMIDTTANSMPFPWYGGLKLPSNTRLILDPNATLKAISNANPKYMVLSLYNADNVIITGGSIVGERDTHTYPNLFSTLATLNAGDYRTKTGYGSWAPVNGMVAYVYQEPSNNGTYTYNAGAWSKTGALPTTSPDLFYTHEYGTGIFVINSRNVWIEKVRISNFTGDSIFIGQAGPDNTLTKGVFVTNCDLTGARRQGISIVQGSDIVITGNRIRDIGARLNLQDGTAPRFGIDIESGTFLKSDNVLISNNVFTDCAGGSVSNLDGNQVTITGNAMGEGCIIYYGYAAGCTISSNVLQGAGITGTAARTQASFTYTQTGTVVTATFGAAHALVDGQSSYLQFLDANSRVVSAGYFTVTVVSSTVITADIGAALTLASGNGLRGHPANNVTIIGNSLYGGYINLNGKGFVVSGNILRDCPNIAMLVGAATSDSIIQGNAIDVASYGIWILTGATNVRVDGNRISGCSTRAIDGSALIVNNSITNCATGIFTGSAKTTVRGNSIDLSAWTGSGTNIFAQGAGLRHEITDNIISGALSTSILIQSPALVANNRVIGSTHTNGINVSGANANGARIVGNYVESARVGAGTVGIFVSVAADSLRVIGNTLTSTGTAYGNAIDTFAGTNSKITNNVTDGTVKKAGTDTETGTVAY